MNTSVHKKEPVMSKGVRILGMFKTMSRPEAFTSGYLSDFMNEPQQARENHRVLVMIEHTTKWVGVRA